MIILTIINIGVSRLRGYISLYMNTQLSYQMQANLFRHVLRLPVSWFEKRHIGDIISRFGSLTPAQSAVTDGLPGILLDGVMTATAMTMMILYAPILTLIQIVTIAVFFSIRMVTYPYLRSRSLEGLHLSSKVQSTFLETLRGARTFKAFGKERERVGVWQNEQAAVINNSVKVAKFGLWGGVGTNLISGLQQMLLWYVVSQTGHRRTDDL